VFLRRCVELGQTQRLPVTRGRTLVAMGSRVPRCPTERYGQYRVHITEHPRLQC
jgi:hypothetical protein